MFSRMMSFSSSSVGVVNNHLQHKAVYLCFGKLVSTFLLNGVLRGHHKEGFWQGESFFANSYLMLLHGFEQCTLHLCGGTVNFVGQYKVGKYRTFFHLEVFFFLRIHERTDNIGRQKVGSELYTTIIGVNKLS